MNLMKETICPYCHSPSVSFKYSEVNAIYRTNENGYPASLPEDTTNHYHCNNCYQDFVTDGAGQFKGVLQPEILYKTPMAPYFKQEAVKISAKQKDYTQGKDENSTDQKLDKIIDLLEKLIAKLN